MFSIRANGDTDWITTHRATEAIREYQGVLEDIESLLELPCNLPVLGRSNPPAPQIDQIAMSGYGLSTPSIGHLLVDASLGDTVDILVDDDNGNPVELTAWRVIRERPVGDLVLLTVTDESWYARQVVHDGTGTEYTSHASWSAFLTELLAPMGFTHAALPGGLPSGYNLAHWKLSSLKGQSLAAIVDYIAAILGLRGVLEDSVVTFSLPAYTEPLVADTCEGGDAEVNVSGGTATVVLFDQYGRADTIANDGNPRTYFVPLSFSHTWTVSELEGWRTQEVFQGALAGGLGVSPSPVWQWIVWDANGPRPKTRYIVGSPENSLLPKGYSFPSESGGVLTGNLDSPDPPFYPDDLPVTGDDSTLPTTELDAVRPSGLEIVGDAGTRVIQSLEAAVDQWGVVSHRDQDWVGEKRGIISGFHSGSDATVGYSGVISGGDASYPAAGKWRTGLGQTGQFDVENLASGVGAIYSVARTDTLDVKKSFFADATRFVLSNTWDSESLMYESPFATQQVYSDVSPHTSTSVGGSQWATLFVGCVTTTATGLSQTATTNKVRLVSYDTGAEYPLEAVPGPSDDDWTGYEGMHYSVVSGIGIGQEAETADQNGPVTAEFITDLYRYGGLVRDFNDFKDDLYSQFRGSESAGSPWTFFPWFSRTSMCLGNIVPGTNVKRSADPSTSIASPGPDGYDKINLHYSVIRQQYNEEDIEAVALAGIDHNFTAGQYPVVRGGIIVGYTT